MKIKGENTKFKALTLRAAPKPAGGEAGWAGTQAALPGRADPVPHFCNSSGKAEAICMTKCPDLLFKLLLT